MNQVYLDHVDSVLERAYRRYTALPSLTREQRDRVEAAVNVLVELLDAADATGLKELRVRSACRSVLLTLKD